MKSNIFHRVVKSAFMAIVLCVMGSALAMERLSPETYREFAYTFIMQNKWIPSMDNMIKICWDGWSENQRAAINQRMHEQGVKEKMISATDYRTVAYINIMNQKWIPSMMNLVENCWNGWSEEQRSAISRRMREQGISPAKNLLTNQKKRMLRGVDDK